MGLIYDLSFRIQAASYFPQSWVQETGLIFYLVDFHGRNWCFPSFYENLTQHLSLIHICQDLNSISEKFVKIVCLPESLEYMRNTSLVFQSPRFKKFMKIRLKSKLSLGLIYGLSFWIQAASYVPQSWGKKTGLIFYLADFHARNWHIPGFYENKTQHWDLFSTKTNQGRFYFHWT